MSDMYKQFLNKQTDWLISQFKEHPLHFLVAADGKQELQEYANRINGELREFENDSFVIKKKNNSLHELFVKADEKKYRTIFNNFLEKYFNFPQGSKIPADFHVDHLYNKKRFKDQYVRLILLEGKQNTCWGSKVESRLTRNERDSRKKTQYYMDFLIFLKAIGFIAFSKEDEIEEYANRAVQHLVDLEIVEASMIPFTKKYMRAELNYIKNGQFIDTQLPEEPSEHFTVHVQTTSPYLMAPLISIIEDNQKEIRLKDEEGNYHYDVRIIEYGYNDKGMFIELKAGNEGLEKTIRIENIQYIEYENNSKCHKLYFFVPGKGDYMDGYRLFTFI